MKKKKNKLSSLLKIGILFFGISILLFNCQKEETQTLNQQNSWKINDITKKNLTNKLDFKSFLRVLNSKKKIKNRGKIETDTLYNFIIDYTTIREIQVGNKTSYTFRVVRENQSESHFENLVIVSTSNQLQNAYLVKYTPKAKIEYIEDHNSITFEGKVNLAELDLENLNYNMKGTSCTDVWVAYCSWNYPHVAGPTCFLPQDGRISYSLETICEDDGFLEPPVDGGRGGSSSFGGGPGAEGDAIPTTPIGVRDQDEPCDTPPKGDLNGDCMLDFYEACLTNVNTSLFNFLSLADQANIRTFIDANGCNEQFINLAIDALIDDGEVDWEDKIINQITDQKIKCLHDNLTKNGNTFVKDLLANFKGNSEFDINISSKDKLFSSVRKKYVNGQASYKKGDKIIYITLSEDKLSDASILSGIRTILHEYIHADIFRKLNTKDNINQDEIKEFKETYEKYENEKHHNSMASLYINSMSNSLKEVHRKILLKEYDYLSDNGTKSLDDLYEALAWQGLKNHKLDAWENLGSDTTRINNALTTYFHSLTKTCPK